PVSASDLSLENETILRLLAFAVAAIAFADLLNTGPSMIFTFSAIALLAASTAPYDVPLVSIGTRIKFGSSRLNNASCAASSKLRPSCSYVPLSGTSNATFTGGKLSRRKALGALSSIFGGGRLLTTCGTSHDLVRSCLC